MYAYPFWCIRSALPFDGCGWFDEAWFWCGEASAVAFALIAPSADDLGVVGGVCASPAVGKDVVDFGAVGSL